MTNATLERLLLASTMWPRLQRNSNLRACWTAGVLDAERGRTYLEAASAQDSPTEADAYRDGFDSWAAR